MICTCVMPCLFSGLAKNNKLTFIFVHFPSVFGQFGSLALKKKGGGRGGQTLNQAVKQNVLVHFSKVQQ